MDLSSPLPVLRTIVAFANSSGGVLLLGVEDRTRNVIGIAKPLDVQEKTDERHRRRNRPAAHAVHRGAALARHERDRARGLFPATPGRIFWSRKAESGVYTSASAPRTRRADSQIQEELARTARNEAYDELPMPELNSEAIDFRAASELFASVRKITKKELAALHLLTRHQKRLVPTNGGMILFGITRGSYFPDARIQAGQFGGTTRSRILDNARVPRLSGNRHRAGDRVRPQACPAVLPDPGGSQGRALERAASRGP